MAISPYFEKLILQGKASHKIWNLSEAVNNINAGRGSNFVVESIRIHPKLNKTVVQSNNNIQQMELINDGVVNTLKVYNNNILKSFSFKQVFSLAVGEQASTTRLFSSAITNILQDVFWLFEGESLTAEVLSMQLNVVSETLGDSKAVNNKRSAPTGLLDPVVNRKHYQDGVDKNFRIDPLGRKTPLPGGEVIYNDFQIPSLGEITTPGDYTGVKSTTTADNVTNPQILSLINIGIIEFNDDVKQQLCEL